MDIIKASNLFLKNLLIPECSVEELYSIMNRNKSRINSKFGLNSENDYRVVIKSTITEETLKEQYPGTYNFISKLCKENEFNVTENWIKNPKRKLSKYLSHQMKVLPLSKADMEVLCIELRTIDVSAIFDVVKPKNVVISTNMYDFFTSSSNSTFRSCYALDGSHFNGNIAYMEDDFTFMIYTALDNLNRKIGRSWGYIPDDSDLFITSRIYGSIYSKELNLATDYIRNCISDKEWKREFCEYENYSNARPNLEYPIPVYFDCCETTIHFTGKISYSELPCLEFKNKISCLNCGKRTLNGYYGICSDCMENISKCNICNTPFHYDNSPHGSVCSECFIKHSKRCDTCGERFLNGHKINGKELCVNCLERNYKYCPFCHEWHEMENMIKNDNIDVCISCSHFLINCQLCGRMIMNDYYEFPYIYDGNIICHHCGSSKCSNMEQLLYSYSNGICYLDGISIEQTWESVINDREFIVRTKIHRNDNDLYLEVNGNAIRIVELRNLERRLRVYGMSVSNFRDLIEYYILDRLTSSERNASLRVNGTFDTRELLNIIGNIDTGGNANTATHHIVI